MVLKEAFLNHIQLEYAAAHSIPQCSSTGRYIIIYFCLGTREKTLIIFVSGIYLVLLHNVNGSTAMMDRNDGVHSSPHTSPSCAFCSNISLFLLFYLYIERYKQ